ncbi:hypothetical protein [Glaciimonas sp. PAMC28666]|nr:hypothetical protein [Glaciimonas sp. PAMC28666]
MRRAADAVVERFEAEADVFGIGIPWHVKVREDALWEEWQKR